MLLHICKGKKKEVSGRFCTTNGGKKLIQTGKIQCLFLHQPFGMRFILAYRKSKWDTFTHLEIEYSYLLAI